MEPRILEIHRILKPTGSFYLHCDWHADAYLRVMCDNIFGCDVFKNHIIWQRTNSSKANQFDPKQYSVLTDSILFYHKSNNSIVNSNQMFIKPN